MKVPSRRPECERPDHADVYRGGTAPVPAPVAVSGWSEAVAVALVKATADSVTDTTPGWLAAYHAFGVPVIDRRATTQPVDPVGP